MAEFRNFTKLEVWIKARLLANSIYRITKKFPKEELFGLTAQMRRAAISIPSNIAEGLGRSHSKEINHFNEIARGSLFELETQVYISSDQQLISNDELNELLQLIEEEKKLLNGFISYYKRKDTKPNTLNTLP